ncbi:MAG: fumarylacetoacetate hydrolase family protein [Phycisphaeraceae bacterium]|nr:fumarylacetoacetate hydrolase family protein [Phycisphaeraceae bacterium]
MNLVRTDHGVAVDTGAGDPVLLRYVLAIGRNYAEHAKELGNAVPDRPVVFTKSPFSLGLSGEEIIIPRICQDQEQVDYEAELAVVIGTSVRDVPIAAALSHVLGYCCANDVSARWWQKSGSGGQWCRGKSFDTFCPLGPTVVPASEVPDPQSLRIRCRVNGETRQDATTRSMIFSVAALISELSQGMTLGRGTVVLTGTPAGVGTGMTPPVFLRHGDRVEVEIEHLGVLSSRVTVE